MRGESLITPLQILEEFGDRAKKSTTKDWGAEGRVNQLCIMPVRAVGAWTAILETGQKKLSNKYMVRMGQSATAVGNAPGVAFVKRRGERPQKQEIEKDRHNEPKQTEAIFLNEENRYDKLNYGDDDREDDDCKDNDCEDDDHEANQHKEDGAAGARG